MSRDKGLRGELELRHLFEAAGATSLHNLEGQGDQILELADVLYHVECKRRERLDIPAWCRQAEGEADARMVPLVVYRSSRQPWRVVLRLDHFLEIAT